MKVNELFWKNKRVFVTGGTGFIGSHLTKKLQKLSSVVKLFVHEKFPENRGLIGVTGDLCNPTPELRRYMESFKPQIIFHLAAQPIVNLALEDHLSTLKVNIDGTYNLLSSCYHLRWVESIVHVSTDKVYGNLPEIKKDSIPNSTTHPYNTSKLSADLLAQMYANTFGTPMTIIRNGNVYGPGDTHWDRLVPNTVRRSLLGQSPVIRGDGSALRDYIYVDDIVTGYLNAAECALGKSNPLILNLGSSHPYSVLDVIDTILESTNRIDLAHQLEPMGVGEIPNQHIVDNSAKDLIGWEPDIELKEGIRMLLPWYARYIGEHKEND